MIIYIELVLIANLIINFFTLIIIKEIYMIRYKITFPIVFIIDILYMLLYIYGFILTSIKYLIPFIFIYLSFKSDIYLYFKMVVMYYLFSYLLGGVSTTIMISGNVAYLLILIIYIIIFLIFYLVFRRKEIFISYIITYCFKGKKYQLYAFFDSGCNLLYKGLPVLILNKKYQFDIHTFDEITFSSGGGLISKDVYYLNELLIGKRKISCYCIFLDIDYEAIVGVNFI